MSQPTILLIDDDRTLLELLGEHLEVNGYRVVAAADGAGGVRLAGQVRPDLVVLDVMMPGRDGWSVCRQLRLETEVPIIMLTAKGEEMDKLRGFHLGVDDYVTKPFSFAELTARVHAVLGRRQASAPSRVVTSGDLAIDLDDARATVAGDPVNLTPTEGRLLVALARNAHRTVATAQLLTEVWGAAYSGETEHVKHYVWSLRRKVEKDPGDPVHIITERSFGYRFE